MSVKTLHLHQFTMSLFPKNACTMLARTILECVVLLLPKNRPVNPIPRLPYSRVRQRVDTHPLKKGVPLLFTGAPNLAQLEHAIW